MALLRKELDAEIEERSAQPGVFEVLVNGVSVIRGSMLPTLVGRIPSSEQVLAAVRQAIAAEDPL